MPNQFGFNDRPFNSSPGGLFSDVMSGFKRHMPRWLRRLLTDDSVNLKVHDAIEERFGDVGYDLQVMDADTVLATASAAGLARWGIDLDERRLANQTNDQYRGALQAKYWGLQITMPACQFAVDKYGISARFYDGTSDGAFADIAFADVDALTVGTVTTLVVVYDPWDPSKIADEADFAQRCLNSAGDLFRTKARGVQLTVFFPPSVTP
jgi:hypothetical protein